jgi:xylulokinase
LEGVAFGLKDIFILIQQSGMSDIHEVRISGGGSKSPIWRQILADVLEVELASVNTTEWAAWGAALLAGVRATFWPDVASACNAAVKITDRTAPIKENTKIYQERYALYRELYPALKPCFEKL